MANATESTDRFKQGNVTAADPALTVRRMREKAPEYWLEKHQGGGADAPQVECVHLRNFLLANGAHLPTDAAASVSALKDLLATNGEVYERTSGTKAPAPGKSAVMVLDDMVGHTLSEVLDGWIEAMADPTQRAVFTSIAGYDWKLTLCSDASFATISQLNGGTLEILTFGDTPTSDHAHRLVSLPFRALTIAGELLQDTLERQGKEFAPYPVTKGADASPNAPDTHVTPSHRIARATDRSDVLNSADPIRGRARRQRQNPKGE